MYFMDFTTSKIRLPIAKRCLSISPASVDFWDHQLLNNAGNEFLRATCFKYIIVQVPPFTANNNRPPKDKRSHSCSSHHIQYLHLWMGNSGSLRITIQLEYWAPILHHSRSCRASCKRAVIKVHTPPVYVLVFELKGEVEQDSHKCQPCIKSCRENIVVALPP